MCCALRCCCCRSWRGPVAAPPLPARRKPASWRSALSQRAAGGCQCTSLAPPPPTRPPAGTADPRCGRRVRAGGPRGCADSPDHNDADSTGVGPTPLTTGDRVRWSTAIGYLAPTRDRLNLTIQSDSQARQVVFDGNRAVGIQGVSGGRDFSVEGEEIILSAGAIGTPHLLLLSGVGPAEQLARFDLPQVYDSPGVGKNLRDHPQAPVMFYTKEQIGRASCRERV